MRKLVRSRARGGAVALATAALLAVLVTGSALAGRAGTRKPLKNVAVAMYARDNPFFAQVVSGLQYEAPKLGVKLTVSWAENNPVQEVNQIQNAISRHPDGLIVSPIDVNAVIPPIKQASQQGIPVVTITDNIAASGRKYQLTYAGATYVDTGRLKARYMIRRLGGKGEIGVVHLIRGLDFTENQWKGAKAEFAKHPGIKIVSQIYAGGAASNLGLQAAENMISAHPNLRGIYVDNDPLALGVIQAVRQAHLSFSKFVIVGADGTPDAFRAIKAGQLGMTIDFCGFAEGRLALKTLHDYVVKGKKPKAVTAQPEAVITKANVGKYMNGRSGCDKP